MMNWMNLARAAKVIALVLFLTPWLVVSCQGSPMIEASGLDLITGDVQPSQDGMMGGFMEQAQAQADFAGDPAGADGSAAGDGVLEEGRWWGLAGAVLIVAGLVLGFVLRPARMAATGALAAGVLALAVLGGGMAWTDHTFEEQKRQALEQQPGGDTEMDAFGRNMAAGLAGAIQMEIKAGYWATLAALGFSVLAAFMAMTGASLPRITVQTQEG
jgi:hypothetical protein